MIMVSGLLTVDSLFYSQGLIQVIDPHGFDIIYCFPWLLTNMYILNISNTFYGYLIGLIALPLIEIAYCHNVPLCVSLESLG